MWEQLRSPWRASPPAIWGKLPGHADFVRSGMRHGESEAWMPWLAQQSRNAGADATVRAVAIPVAFVLPPGTLEFARQRFVLGVIAPSIDKVGRHHPLVIYQQAHPRWVQAHFRGQLQQPLDWQFWLARAVARHTRARGASDLRALEHTVRALWREQMQPQPTDGIPRGATEVQHWRMQAALDHWAGEAPLNDPAVQLHGVRYLPWADWPERLDGPRAESAFWQQDAQGRFIGAANKLQKLWGGGS
ncbi:type VI secretion system-associated protein TagF [Variovorax sp. EL159]|uniref:type VI secretion system-associated protein TagF n=1 Tax=Variovorax sp. EL159 TaxID=1566270 RepID=UPI00088E8AAB|nr:type VI secretion system-associated protein TagF [Variovorax sp. EL159]SCX68198.1 type VI secretion system protein ImpM [Variovorax sp. EL159]